MSGAHTLILGWGNPGRRDDGLGPALAAAVAADAPAGVTVDTDYQLQVEDAAELARHARVLLVDADRSGGEPFTLRRLAPGSGSLAFSSHSVTPQALLALSRDLFGSVPETWLMGIRGYEFDEFGEGLSPRAGANLAAATTFVRAALDAGAFHEFQPSSRPAREPRPE